MEGTRHEPRREDADGSGAAFGAPSESTGLAQGDLAGDIIILPGGVMLVDQSSPLADCPELGRPITGPIYCDNGR
jgi:hypothetical protein